MLTIADVLDHKAASTVRPIHAIAAEIIEDWRKQKSEIYFGAVPYLKAMLSLNKISEYYSQDSGESVVHYFLSNATSYRGEVARRCKAELKAMLKSVARR